MSRKTDAIAVFGASGHTGRFVISEIARRGLEAIPVGRDAAKLPKSARLARLDEPSSLDAALAGVGAVINCAGPFLDTAMPVVDAALRARIPYLDITAEQAAAALVFEARGAAAREAGVPLLPAAAFFGGLADLLVSALADSAASLDEVIVVVGLDFWRPTAGTRLTGRRNTAPRLIQRGGKLTRVPAPPPQARWTFSDPLGPREIIMAPFSETIMTTSHLAVDSLSSWINVEPIRDIRDPATPTPGAADPAGRSSQRFIVDVVVRDGNKRRQASVSGVDIYHASAPIVVEATERLLRGETGVGGGVFALGAAFDARDFLKALEGGFFTVSFDASPQTLPEKEKTDA